jgi:8-oxo-dGTP pyrophosphatase MutT (NUDIX family)
MMRITLNDVRTALALKDFDAGAAWRRMAPQPRAMHRPLDWPGKARLAGVLVLLYPHGGALSLVLNRRSDSLDVHGGQISFPGGRREGNESLVQTALRETEEELGVAPASVEVVGSLTSLYAFSDFEIHPTVGYTPLRPDWHPNPDEVDRLLELPLAQLLDDAIKAAEEWEWDGGKMWVPFYRVQGETVWGATGIILCELEWRLRAVLGA